MGGRSRTCRTVRVAAALWRVIMRHPSDSRTSHTPPERERADRARDVGTIAWVQSHLLRRKPSAALLDPSDISGWVGRSLRVASAPIAKCLPAISFAVARREVAVELLTMCLPSGFSGVASYGVGSAAGCGWRAEWYDICE